MFKFVKQLMINIPYVHSEIMYKSSITGNWGNLIVLLVAGVTRRSANFVKSV